MSVCLACVIRRCAFRRLVHVVLVRGPVVFNGRAQFLFQLLALNTLLADVERIPVGAPLRAALDAKPGKAGLILLNSNGEPWTADGFRASWRKACQKAGIVGLTFNDLRGTAATRLAVAGCSVPEIATITRHSLRDVAAILDSNCLNRDSALAESAILKLETGTKFPD